MGQNPYTGLKRDQIGGQNPCIGPKRGQIGGQKSLYWA